MYKNSSDEEKIKMARNIATYLGRYLCDYEMKEDHDWSDVPSEVIWEEAKESWFGSEEWHSAWVCRHHHSEVAKFLRGVWITAWVITTNYWWPHAIVLWKLSNWNYFLIDYNHYFESKDFLDLKDRYLASHWAIDLKEYTSDPDWNIVKIIQTALEQEFENTTSSINTWDSMSFSKILAQNWVKLIKWFNIDVDIEADTNNKSSKKVDISYGKGTDFWYYKWWVFYKNTQWLWYSIYQSTWAYIRWKWWNRDWKMWELSLWIKCSNNKFDYDTWKTAQYNVLSWDLSYDKQIDVGKKDKLNIWATIQWSLMFDDTEGHSWYYNTFLWQEQRETWNWWFTLDWEHIINENWKFNTWAMYWFDVWPWNIRWWKWYKLYGKYGVYGWIEYKSDKNNEDLIVKLDWSYEKWLWYNKYWMSWVVKKWKIWLQAEYQIEKDTTYFHFPDRINTKIGLVYDITDYLQWKVEYFQNNNMWQENTWGSIWIVYRF